MSWARIDDGFHDHPKIDELTLAAVGLWTLCLTWAHRHRKTALTPGHITEARVRKIAGKQTATLVRELVGVNLWEASDELGGWVIHDFADYLPRERDPEELRAAGRRGGTARAAKLKQADSSELSSEVADSKQAPSKVQANAVADSSSRASAPAFPSRPVPLTTPEGGQRTETLRPVDATKHPPEPPPGTRPAPRVVDESRCSKHPDGNLTNEPCAGCARVREYRDKAADRDAEKRRRELEDARNHCDRCDGTWLTDEEGRPTRRKCDHQRRTA